MFINALLSKLLLLLISSCPDDFNSERQLQNVTARATQLNSSLSSWVAHVSLRQPSAGMSHRCRTGSVSDLCLLISLMSSQYALVMTGGIWHLFNRYRFFGVRLVIYLLINFVKCKWAMERHFKTHRRHRSCCALSSRQADRRQCLVTCLTWNKASWLVTSTQTCMEKKKWLSASWIDLFLWGEN